MTKFISVRKTKENHPTHWFYLQEADTKEALEANPTYEGENTLPKNQWMGTRVSNSTRFIHDVHGMGAVEVISYKVTK